MLLRLRELVFVGSVAVSFLEIQVADAGYLSDETSSLTFANQGDATRAIQLPREVLCDQCHNGTFRPTEAELRRIDADPGLRAAYMLQAPVLAAEGRISSFIDSDARVSRIMRAEDALPANLMHQVLSNEDPLISSGKYKGRGQCPSYILEEVEAKCAEDTSRGFQCKRTDLIQDKSQNWLTSQLLPLFRVGQTSQREMTALPRNWNIDTSYNLDGASVHMLSPHGVYVIDNFLTPDEAQHVMHSSGDQFDKVGIGCPVLRHDCYDKNFLTYPGSHCEVRDSYSVWHRDVDDPIIPQVRRKFEELTRVRQEFYEMLQVTRYDRGQFFSAHYDDDGCNKQIPQLAEKCELEQRRMITVLTYLNDVQHDEGGATYFPELDLRVQPKQGRAVVFFPVGTDGLLNPYLRHASEDAHNTKFVMQQWIGLGGARAA